MQQQPLVIQRYSYYCRKEVTEDLTFLGPATSCTVYRCNRFSQARLHVQPCRETEQGLPGWARGPERGLGAPRSTGSGAGPAPPRRGPHSPRAPGVSAGSGRGR